MNACDDAGIPALGICLGARLLARAAGAADPVTGALPGKIPVLQWQEDTLSIPEGGVLLAESEACPHQESRVGNAWSLQFHVEADRNMPAEWFHGKKEEAEILRRHDEVRSEFDTTAEGAR